MDTYKKPQSIVWSMFRRKKRKKEEKRKKGKKEKKEKAALQ